MSSIQLPLYQQLADHYLDAIRMGALKVGDRFPSVRQLMRTHEVSLSTALQTCRKLEEQGWLHARPRSGYYVQRARRTELLRASESHSEAAIDPANYVGIHSHVSEILAHGQRHSINVNLALALGSTNLYPAAALNRIMQRMLRQQPRVLTTMARRHGHPALREVLARRALEFGVSVAPHEIVITHGCIEAVNLALRAVTRPGDTVAVECPTFYGLLQVLETQDLKVIEIPTSPNTGISLDALEFALDHTKHSSAPIKAVICMPTLHNPLGCVMPDSHKERLVRLIESRKIALIEDDIYADMGTSGMTFKPAKAWDRSGSVIYCNSLNKILAPGLRLGYMLAGRWQARVEMLKYTQSRYAEELPQMVAAEFIGSAGYGRHINKLQQTFKQQREQMAEAIATYFPVNTRLSAPLGGLLLWVELPKSVSSEQVFYAALEQGIKVAPGSMFSNSHKFDNYLRLSCGGAHSDTMVEALRVLGEIVKKFVDDQCSKNQVKKRAEIIS
jgi:DNA-binding transcriptional MocR family regulator